MSTRDNQQQHEERSPELKRAINQFKRGHTIPLDLAVELMNQGHDVQALESKYRP
ncbi:hypothetical protein [Pseudoduganella lutea]|uniref:hypothetical protein n=1 Tax=Pseudoduganella lutea TaxID=321985 RepID=UPI0013EE61CA|nr:hypothetical protein [Pseudoduganella lutea]